MIINIGIRHYAEVNSEVREVLEKLDEVRLNEVYGQRYIGAGLLKGKKIVIEGTPGNDLGIYLSGGEIEVYGNGQDAVGNTMNGGKITIYGSVGDAMGYSMRDGEIFVKGDCGYRGGIHMKEYKEMSPVIVIGGKTGSYLGEYMAGGKIIVLNLSENTQATGDYLATGMHGGVIYIRGVFDRAVL
jgi:glutamate synthase domain-containing protein 3